MSEVSRKVVPDMGSLNRERPVTEVSILHKSFFHLNWNGVCEKECIQRDTRTGMVAGYHQRSGKQRWLS